MCARKVCNGAAGVEVPFCVCIPASVARYGSVCTSVDAIVVLLPARACVCVWCMGS